jgi:hypothetical protein
MSGHDSIHAIEQSPTERGHAEATITVQSSEAKPYDEKPRAPHWWRFE